MSFSIRPRVAWSVLAVIVVTGILTAAFWTRDDGGKTGNVASANDNLTSQTSPDVVAPKSPPAREDFSSLPPRERINAETKQRMEEAAAWREKLRNRDHTTLPPEAYPPGVPPHAASAPQ